MAHRTIKALGGKIKEKNAAAAITPGMLIERVSAGTVQAHSTAGGFAQKLFAMESLEVGAEVSTAYAATNPVRMISAAPGDEVVGRLFNGETAVIGSKLESQGDGTLKVADTDVSIGDVGTVVGVALEAVDMSGSDAADPSALILIEVA